MSVPNEAAFAAGFQVPLDRGDGADDDGEDEAGGGDVVVVGGVMTSPRLSKTSRYPGDKMLARNFALGAIFL